MKHPLAADDIPGHTPRRPRPVTGRAARAPPPWTPANVIRHGISLGTAVKIWLPDPFWNHGKVHEGVVTHVVPPGAPLPCPVMNDRSPGRWRDLAEHYIVRCSAGSVVRRAAEIDVVSL